MSTASIDRRVLIPGLPYGLNCAGLIPINGNRVTLAISLAGYESLVAHSPMVIDTAPEQDLAIE
ncbi:hypothetical protein CERZMDRAFT_94850 [Cercospora zeae-maydis SCOH1-5]|uniref:Uncharacterized protein n=1 Tax=Cercospora zeae-maydis SCOH1-5 TaxID=717836 RepID=A0A6A6FPY4_9PEZI|nr:hypothetical protein CERZMDRAFT_94850 [Cercospora zeae-maydis SCOH1-5]